MGWTKGKKFSKEHKEKISKALKGVSLSEEHRISLCKARRAWKPTEEHKRKTSETLKGKLKSEETKRKLSEAMVGRKLTKEHIRKVLKRNPKSLLEIKFESIIHKLNLPYKFVGNGEFFIERKCPDFINTEGNKIAIEVYYRKHKELFRSGLEDWKNQRFSLFKKYGWQLIFFNEIQVNEDCVSKVLNEEVYR